MTQTSDLGQDALRVEAGGLEGLVLPARQKAILGLSEE